MLKELIKKMKNASFWMSLSGAVVMVLQCLGVKVSAPYVNEVISAICSVFVIVGIMTPAKSEKEESESVCVDSENTKNGSDKNEYIEQNSDKVNQENYNDEKNAV